MRQLTVDRLYELRLHGMRQALKGSRNSTTEQPETSTEERWILWHRAAG